MAGKGDADTRSPDLGARSRTWDRVFRNRWTTEDALNYLAKHEGVRFEARVGDLIYSLESDYPPTIKWSANGYMYRARPEDMLRFLHQQCHTNPVWSRTPYKKAEK
jgi:hypothetical protein